MIIRRSSVFQRKYYIFRNFLSKISSCCHFMISSIFYFRASPYSQRQNIPILDIPQSMNHASSSIQDQLLQNRMLSGQHTVSPRAATTAAFANILRHVQQLRTEGRPFVYVFSLSICYRLFVMGEHFNFYFKHYTNF